MAIVCRKCKEGISIAKYYPQGAFIAGVESGWGQYPLNTKSIDGFFAKHAHGFDRSFLGGHQYYLGYEDKGKWKYYHNELTEGK